MPVTAPWRLLPTGWFVGPLREMIDGYEDTCHALNAAAVHKALILGQLVMMCRVLQHRIAAGVKQMLQLWFDHKPFPEEFYIVREGKLAEQYT